MEEGDAADASRMAGHQEESSSSLPQGQGAPASESEPPVPQDGDVVPLPSSIAYMLQLASDVHRRGIGPNYSAMARHLGGSHGGIGEDDDAYRNGGFGAVPAASEAIASLPETTVTETTVMEEEEEEDEDEECAVCSESYEEGDKVRTMPCSHGFHGSCIIRWLGISRLCPLCRFALKAE